MLPIPTIGFTYYGRNFFAQKQKSLFFPSQPPSRVQIRQKLDDQRNKQIKNSSMFSPICFTKFF